MAESVETPQNTVSGLCGENFIYLKHKGYQCTKTIYPALNKLRNDGEMFPPWTHYVHLKVLLASFFCLVLSGCWPPVQLNAVLT